MAETITPVVHGGKRKPYLVASALHVIGATASAALLGLALGTAGALVRAPWEATPAIVAGFGALYFLREAFGLPIPLPDRKRQVPEWWRTFYSPGVAALLYGIGLGAGFLTYLSFGTFVVVASGAFASGDALVGALLCSPFGLGRAVAVVAVTWEGRPELVDRLDETAQSAAGRLNAVALAAVTAAATAALL